MSVITKVSRWGHSSGIRIPLRYMKALHLNDNQNVKIYIKNYKLVIEPITKKPHSIKELFKGYHDDGKRDHELDWGKPRGNETW